MTNNSTDFIPLHTFAVIKWLYAVNKHDDYDDDDNDNVYGDDYDDDDNDNVYGDDDDDNVYDDDDDDNDNVYDDDDDDVMWWGVTWLWVSFAIGPAWGSDLNTMAAITCT